MFSSVRTRLTLWYAGVFGLILIVFSIGVYGVSNAALQRRVAAALQSLGQAAAVSLAHETAEGESIPLAARSTVTGINLPPHEAIAVFEDGGGVLATRGAISAEALRTAITSRASAESSTGHRIEVRSLAFADRRYTIVVSHAVSGLDGDLAVLRGILFGAVPAGVLLSVAAGWFLAGQALQPIDEMLRQQRQFMTDASHELRTPLSVISSAAEVTLDSPQSDQREYRDALTMIQLEARRLRRLVEDMFTLARADAGQLTVQRASLYLDEIVADAVRAVRVIAADNDVSVQLTGDTDLSYTGDESMLRRLMLNLLDNAVRHSRHGGAVDVNLAKTPDAYVISVKDSGHGIPPEAWSLIFTRFYQVDSARTHSARDGRGAGLGLPIARWIAEAHHGSLELVDSSERGSTFVVTLSRDNSNT